jgi:F-type H+-transporting ATPase subunit b
VNINLTLIVQMLVFIVLIWFTMKFVWPMILGPMEERSRKIALGLAAAEKGQQDLAQAQVEREHIIRDARHQAVQIVDQAQHRASEAIEQAKQAAVAAGQRLLDAAQEQIERETNHARGDLRKEIAALVLEAAGKLLEREIDPKAHADFLNKLAARIDRPANEQGRVLESGLLDKPKFKAPSKFN